MYPSLVLSAALVAPAAPLPRDTVPNVTGPAPRVLALKADGSGSVRVTALLYVKQTVTATQFIVEGNKQVQKQIEYDTITTQYLNKVLADFDGKFTTADGRQLTANEATARVKAGATVLASADGQPISKAWLQSAHPDTVVMVADGLKHAQIQWGSEPYPNTPPPQLAMLSAQNKGGVIAQVTTQATGQTYYDNIQFEGRVNRRGIAQWAGDGIYYPGNSTSDAKVVSKPLAEVKFEAYDLNGKLVSRNETLKRLAAGGMVLVAGDNRMPDAAYLKGFREDILVLVGSELVLPIPPLDQTKKKQEVVKQQIRIFRD
ncbi:hypothetical protein GobsT_19950 [Gemmata obscuriglobus]|uniref:Uncharacterized protein n=1 Tax=Gemmata obscuriglobus TaxID=114 RepID=A0A2Z3H7W0_9BACT|nr:hypothetical protein [Gemmata obscuriglobus]AWM39656.1 hypothetical protein C1280_23415 [Gemmata obscuriglobus]QEG27241.1 hypothetical protein GobsT_19950 [Gemmata obscuriglobus]VTS03996.1 unnamed protein product [Gemmata obscuriglobus UQM 2246]